MIHYEVDEQNRTVTASIQNCSEDVIKRLRHKIPPVVGVEGFIKYAKIKDSFKTTVRCHPEDKFDAEVGKQIAKRSLLNQYNTARVNALRRVDEVLAGSVHKGAESVSRDIQRLLRKFA